MTKMSAKRHLKELQWRFMLIAAFFVTGALLAFQYRDLLMPILLDPLHGQKLVYLTPGGGFTFTFLVAAYAGLALAFPVLLQQLYSFLRPALPEKAQRKSAAIIISSVLLLIAGIIFGYIVAVPSALTFLYGFADQYVTASLTAESYINFVVAYTIGIGIVFQLPLLLLLLHAIKPQTPGGLMRSQKWVILIAFIVAAIITPTPDPVNQAIIAGPVVVVYQIGVIAVLFSIWKSTRKARSEVRKAARNAQVSLEELASPEPAIEAEAAKPLVAFEETAPVVTPVAPAEAPQPIATSLEKSTEADEAAADELLYDAIEAEMATPAVVDTTIADTAPIPEPLTISEPLPAPVVLSRPQQPKVIDGFTRRSSAPIQVPARPIQPERHVPAAPVAGPARGFYVDGIIAPRTA